jgi:hypothetical protein
LIEGATAVAIRGTGTVQNAGVLYGFQGSGIDILGSGSVVNASSGYIRADGNGVSISGAGSVGNYGTIRAAFYGVSLASGGVIENQAQAVISGGRLAIAISGGAGTVVNAGVLYGYAGGLAVGLADGGSVTNAVDGLIGGGYGIDILAAAGTVQNQGTIECLFYGYGSGIELNAGGTIDNGSGARILGAAFGASLVHGGTVLNAGLIGAGGGIGAFGHAAEAGGIGIDLGGAGYVDNGGIVGGGYGGLGTRFGPDYRPGAGGAGIQLANNDRLVDAGVIFGGTGGRYYQSIQSPPGPGTGGTGGAGVSASGRVTIVNRGTIAGGQGGAASTLGSVGDGVMLQGGGTLQNQAAGFIEGGIGVTLAGVGTVSNAGTIASTSGALGIAVALGTGADVLIDQAGAVFVGLVEGGNGTLELTGRTGTLTGLGTSFTGFSRVDLAAGAAWDTTGADIASGLFIDAGTLVDQGTLTLQHGGTLSGSVSGSGTLVLTGGTTGLDGGLGVAQIVLAGGTAALGLSLTDTHGFTQSGGTLALGSHVLSLDDGASFSGGMVTGTSYLQTSGTVTLGHLTLAGGLTWQVFGTLTDTGTLILGAIDTFDRLTVETGGQVVLAGDEQILVASGGTGAVANAGLIEKNAGGGRATIAPAIGNAGTIAVTSGTLELKGALTGAGSLSIGAAATLALDGSVGTGQQVDFASTTGGALVLKDASGFLGTVAGLGGSDKIDLTGLAYAGNAHPGWTQQGMGGTLTVTEGSTTLSIKLFGQYMAAGFHAGQGVTGTAITYTTPTQQIASLTAPHH